MLFQLLKVLKHKIFLTKKAPGWLNLYNLYNSFVVFVLKGLSLITYQF